MVRMRGKNGNLTSSSSDGIADMEGKKKVFLSLGDYLLHEKDLESQRRSTAKRPVVTSGNLSGSTDDGSKDPTAKEIAVCFEKDICIDEGPNVSKCCDETDLEIKSGGDDDRKKQVYTIDDGHGEGEGEIAGFDSRTSSTKGKEFESGDDTAVREENDRNLFLENTKTSPDNSSSSSYSSSDDVDDKNNNQSPTVDLERNASKSDQLEQEGTVQQEHIVQNITTEQVVHQAVSIAHHIPPQPIMIGPHCLSDRIISGQPENSGSISIRSESSNTSARSFAFPMYVPSNSLFNLID